MRLEIECFTPPTLYFVALIQYILIFLDGSIEFDSDVTVLTSNVPRFISWPVRHCVHANIIKYSDIIMYESK